MTHDTYPDQQQPDGSQYHRHHQSQHDRYSDQKSGSESQYHQAPPGHRPAHDAYPDQHAKEPIPGGSSRPETPRPTPVLAPHAAGCAVPPQGGSAHKLTVCEFRYTPFNTYPVVGPAAESEDAARAHKEYRLQRNQYCQERRDGNAGGPAKQDAPRLHGFTEIELDECCRPGDRPHAPPHPCHPHPQMYAGTSDLSHQAADAVRSLHDAALANSATPFPPGAEASHGQAGPFPGGHFALPAPDVAHAGRGDAAHGSFACTQYPVPPGELSNDEAGYFPGGHFALPVPDVAHAGRGDAAHGNYPCTPYPVPPAGRAGELPNNSHAGSFPGGHFALPASDAHAGRGDAAHGDSACAPYPVPVQALHNPTGSFPGGHFALPAPGPPKVAHGYPEVYGMTAGLGEGRGAPAGPAPFEFSRGGFPSPGFPAPAALPLARRHADEAGAGPEPGAADEFPGRVGVRERLFLPSPPPAGRRDSAPAQLHQGLREQTEQPPPISMLPPPTSPAGAAPWAASHCAGADAGGLGQPRHDAFNGVSAHAGDGRRLCVNPPPAGGSFHQRQAEALHGHPGVPVENGRIVSPADAVGGPLPPPRALGHSVGALEVGRALQGAMAIRPLSMTPVAGVAACTPSGFLVKSKLDDRLSFLVAPCTVTSRTLRETEVEALSKASCDRRAFGVVIVVPADTTLTDAASVDLMAANTELVFENASLSFTIGKALDALATASAMGSLRRC
ncbi:hypothetical protein DIPPA_33640 [Diplonema papillatum]|nr:hypothetical protein DIPPA_33640 [Diplonema papillatum]